MAFVRVEQRNARLASAVKVDFVKGRDGNVAKGTVTVISNGRRGSRDERSEEATSIQWTLWGAQAEHAALYLSKGSHVNVVGRLQNNNYQDAQGGAVYALDFTCEEIDYLESKTQSQARRARAEGAESSPTLAAIAAPATPLRARRASRQGRRANA